VKIWADWPGSSHLRFGQGAAIAEAIYAPDMCRSIITLRRPDQSPTDQEVHAAALQYVRKISGYRVPSKKNEDAFNAAVEEIAHASQHLLEAVGATATTHESAA
jgi:hypothetical protein